MSNNWIAKTAINGCELYQVIKAKEILETFGYSEFTSFRKITIIDWLVFVTGANGRVVRLVVDTLEENIHIATDEDFDASLRYANTYE